MRESDVTGPTGPAGSSPPRRTNGTNVLVPKRTIAVLAVAFAVLAGSTGVMASALVEQQATAHESEFGVSFSSIANWPSISSVSASIVSTGTTKCDTSWTGSTGAAYFAGTAATLNLGAGPNGTCRGGDFAEALTFAPASSVTTEVDTFTFVLAWEAPNGTNEATSTAIAVDVNGGTTGGEGVTFLLDLGASAPPSEVSSVSVVVT